MFIAKGVVEYKIMEGKGVKENFLLSKGPRNFSLK